MTDYLFMLNPNISDETCEKLLAMTIAHRKNRRKWDLEIMEARMKLEEDLLAIQQEPSRLLNMFRSTKND